MSNALANPRVGRPYQPQITLTGQPIIPDKAIDWLESWDCNYFSDTGTQTTLATGTPIEFFRVPRNQVGSGFAIAKSLEITNQLNPNTFERGKTVNVDSILVSVYAPGTGSGGDVVAQVIKSFLEDSVLEFWVNNKRKLQARLKMVASGSSITGIAPMNGVTPQTFVAFQPTIMGVKGLVHKINVPARTKFNCYIYPNTNNTLLSTALSRGNDIMVRVRLRGFTTRRVGD